MRSESRFFWEQVLFLIKLPFLFVMVVLGKRDSSELIKPIKEFFVFIYEAKITFYLIVINIAVFIIEIFLITKNPDALNSFIFQPEHLKSFNFIPMIASWFLHAGILHLFGNMIALFIFGRVVEIELRAKMLIVYFVAAVISDLISAIAGIGGIGASGAIAGLVAVGILIKPFYTTFIGGAPLFILGWGYILADVMGILVPQQTNINHFAHLGGYLSVLVLYFIFSREHKQKMVKGLMINIAVLVLILLFKLVFLS